MLELYVDGSYKPTYVLDIYLTMTTIQLVAITAETQ